MATVRLPDDTFRSVPMYVLHSKDTPVDVSDWSMCLTVLRTEISPDEQLFWLTDYTETVNEACDLCRVLFARWHVCSVECTRNAYICGPIIG